MHYIATAVLVAAVLALTFIALEIKLLRQDFIEFTKLPLNTNVLFNPDIVELIRNWRKTGPRTKKETV